MRNAIIITAEAVSAIFAIMIMFGAGYRISEKTRKTRVYLSFLGTEIVALIIDMLSYAMEGSANSRLLLYTVNFLSFVMIDILLAIYAYYIVLVINKKKKGTLVFAWIVGGISVVNIIFALIGTISGKLFYVDECGNYINGPWRDTRAYLPFISVVIIWIMIIKDIKEIEKSYLFAICLYAAVPVVTVVSVLIFVDYDFSYVLSGIACTAVFIFVQKEEVLEAKFKENLIKKLSVQDVLTGLKNRRGYEELVEKYEGRKDIGIVFCDLNSLKCINDTKGHAAGDEYIKHFADILREVYKNNCEICRISGDEFVVITDGIEFEIFRELAVKLKALIDDNNKIASVGFAYEDMPILSLVSKAEQEMYEEKRMYYKMTGYTRERLNN
ncbi:MAG: GGDEF domain-containing protein [Lachnospiraceae bacterium]|nr:GGDEF domain-containing protein [Lachnospiraceae bacterium]